tara:strand:- start:747 stop:1358 length:612 start_codon:yes stop_codon:yes gene_type:complete
MEIDFGTLLTEIGYGLGAAIVLYVLYNRMSRMNERTVELQTTLEHTLDIISEQNSAATDIKSATVRAAEMDRLYQSNHEMMIAGHATIIDSIPTTVEQLADEQQHLSQDVKELGAGLNAFATSSLERQQELLGDIVILQKQFENDSVKNSESSQQFETRLENLTSLLEQLSRGMALMVSSNETNFTKMNKSIVTIETKLLEEF